MNRQIVFLFWLGVFLGTVGCSASRSKTKARPPSKTVAVVNRRKITLRQLDLAVQQVKEDRIGIISPPSLGLSRSSSNNVNLRNMAMTRLINEQLLLQEADKRGLTATEKEINDYLKKMFGRKLLESGSLFDSREEKNDYIRTLREQVGHEIIKTKLKDDIFKNTVVSDRDIEKYYEDHQGQFILDATIRLQIIHIRVPPGASREFREKAERKINILRTMILRGSDFGELAKKHSDDIASAGQGGDMGYFRKSLEMPGIQNKVFHLKVRQLSKIIKEPEGYYLLRVTEKKDVALKSLPVVKETIRETLQVDMNINAAHSLITGLRKNAKIKIY